MKNYAINENIITVLKNFDVYSTLHSGQVFRVKPVGEKKYMIISGDKCAILEEGENPIITTNHVDYFVNYFDLDSDYGKYTAKAKDKYAASAVGFSPSLRIMKQDKFETIINFIMSANNNIKRFSKTLELIAETYGKKMQYLEYEYYAFPTPKELSCAEVSKLKELGCGYRDKYIISTANSILNGFDLDCVVKLDTISGNKKLCELMGIGEKVADCILLFAYQKYDAFPVDTWIEKIYHENYGGESTNRREIRKFFVDKYGKYAGVVQQYIFYYKREV